MRLVCAVVLLVVLVTYLWLLWRDVLADLWRWVRAKCAERAAWRWHRAAARRREMLKPYDGGRR